MKIIFNIFVGLNLVYFPYIGWTYLGELEHLNRGLWLATSSVMSLINIISFIALALYVNRKVL